MVAFSPKAKPGSSVSGPQSCVPPQRILAERLLRSVKAKSEAEGGAPSQLGPSQLRPREWRPVALRSFKWRFVQSRTGLPRSFASRWDGPKQQLVSLLSQIKRAARARISERIGERFGSVRQYPVVRNPVLRTSVSRPAKSVASRLH
jgi:hypothetical protein